MADKLSAFRGFRKGPLWLYEYHDSIDSCVPNFTFNLRFSLRCRSTARLEIPLAQSLAAWRARKLVEPVAALFDVSRADAAEHELNIVLSRDFPGRQRDMELCAATVGVNVDETVRRAAELLAQSKRDIEREGLERSRLATEIRFLRDEVFCDPASARLYWIAKHNVLPDAAALGAIVTSVAQWSTQNQWVVIAQLIQRFLEPYPRQRIQDLMRLLEIHFRDNGRDDLAKEVARFLDR